MQRLFWIKVSSNSMSYLGIWFKQQNEHNWMISDRWSCRLFIYLLIYHSSHWFSIISIGQQGPDFIFRTRSAESWASQSRSWYSWTTGCRALAIVSFLANITFTHLTFVCSDNNSPVTEENTSWLHILNGIGHLDNLYANKKQRIFNTQDTYLVINTLSYIEVNHVCQDWYTIKHCISIKSNKKSA